MQISLIPTLSMFNKNWWFLNFQKECLNFSLCIRKLAVAFYMINEIQPKIKWQILSNAPLSGHFGFYTYFCCQKMQLKHILLTDLTFWITVLIWNWNSDFKKHFILIWIFILWQKWWFLTYLWIFWCHFEGCPISRISRILKICQMLLLLTVYCIQIWFHTSKSISHHFHVQIMAKMVIFHLFQNILAAILKGALYLEFSRILKICYMLLLLTVYFIQIWFLTSKIIFSSFYCSNYGQNGNFSPILGYFGGHFERRPIFRIFYNFENMLYAIATYCLLHTNLISDFKKHFLIILVFKLCPKWWFFTYIRIFWRPFWKAPYI